MTIADHIYRSFGLNCCGAVVAAALSVGSPALGQTPPAAAPTETRIIAEFQRGISDRDAAEVLGVLGPVLQSRNVRIRKIVLTPNDASLCVVIERYLRMRPGACTEPLARDFLDFSARSGGATTFAAGNELSLPLIETETFKALHHFDLKSQRQRGEVEALYKDEGFSATKRREFLVTQGQYTQKAITPAAPLRSLPTDGLLAVEMEGVRWKVPLSGEVTSESLNELEGMSTQKSTGSRVIGVERAGPLQRVPGQKFAPTAPAALATQCTDALPTQPTHPVSYVRLLTTDQIHIVAELEAAQACSLAGEPQRLVVIDTPIAPHPDLRGALGMSPSTAPAGGPVCGPAASGDFQEVWHGTYVAGLIAAGGAHAPYKGINPNVRLVVVTDTAPIAVRQRLRDAYNDGLPTPPNIALYATTFGTEEPPTAADAAPSPKDLAQRYKRHRGKWLNELRDSKTRLTFPPSALEVVDNVNYRYLFVISAGQDSSSDEWPSPLSLRDVTNMSPQNLGTRHNALVVTACTACDAPNGEAALWPRAYYSSPGDQIVQLAAPGGDYIPGIVNEQQTGGPDNGGTSAAAAIVAGIASRMLACYPRVYGAEPRLMKERLLVTARRNLNADDEPKAQAGIVDPYLAMIDPEKTWLKPTGLPLESIDINGWCRRTLDMTRSEAGDEVPENAVQARIRRVTRAGDRYTLREMGRETIGLDTPTLKITNLKPEQSQNTSPIALVTRAGKPACKLFLKDVQDLIVGLRELRRHGPDLHADPARCRAAPPCFETTPSPSAARRER